MSYNFFDINRNLIFQKLIEHKHQLIDLSALPKGKYTYTVIGPTISNPITGKIVLK
jgi:hypothetical protein